MKIIRALPFFLALALALAGVAIAQDQAKPQRPQNRCADRHAALDKDKDGNVTLEEFAAGACPGCDQARVETVFKRRDVNGDGKITAEEFCATRGQGQGMGKSKGAGKPQ